MAANMAPALVYALWTEDRHDDGHGQLRGLFASLEAAQADAAANCTVALSAWRPAVGYLDDAAHGGETPVQAEATYQAVQRPCPPIYQGGELVTITLATYTIEPITVQGAAQLEVLQ